MRRRRRSGRARSRPSCVEISCGEPPEGNVGERPGSARLRHTVQGYLAARIRGNESVRLLQWRVDKFVANSPIVPIRHAQPADLPAIVEIYNASIPGRMATADTAPVTVASARGWFRDSIPTGGRCGCTATPARPIAGWLSLRSFYGRPAYHATVEVAVYVDPRRAAAGRRAARCSTTRSPRARRWASARCWRFVFAHNAPVAGAVRARRLRRWGLLPARGGARRRRARPRDPRPAGRP